MFNSAFLFLVVYVSFCLAVLPFAVPGSSEFDVTFWGFEVWHFLFGRSRYPFFGLVLFGPFDFFFFSGLLYSTFRLNDVRRY